MANAMIDVRFLKSGLHQQVDDYFAALGQGTNAYLERRMRMAEILSLNAKSDAELARMGLEREEIPSYVFRDLFGA